MPDKFTGRKECDMQHDRINDEFKEIHGKLDYIVGKVDGMTQQKGTDITFFGMLGAILLGLWNMIK